MDNSLLTSDVLELEEAGLDVEELEDMTFLDRFNAIESAGLSPMDYDYGFYDDYSKYDAEPIEPVKPIKRKSFFDMTVNNPAPVNKPVKTAPIRPCRLAVIRLMFSSENALPSTSSSFCIAPVGHTSLQAVHSGRQ